ncbi:Methanogenesis regulatory histidine kinase FilI [uncultured archaeon]|nr:Methanogenesis regulatory histidine kinase FilI [uncultured archaeon]
MKIIFKLTFGFFLMAILLGAMGLVSLENARIIQYDLRDMNEQTLPSIDSLNNMKVASLDVFSHSMEILVMGDKGSQIHEHGTDEVNGAKQQFETNFLIYNSSVQMYFPNETHLRDHIKERWDVFANLSEKVILLKESGADAKDLFNAQQEFEGAKEDLLKTIDDALANEGEEIVQAQKAAETEIYDSLNKVLAIIWIFVIVGSVVILVSFSISKSVNDLKDAAERIGKGNLNMRIDIKSNDELGILAASFNQMTASLKNSRKDLEDKAGELEKSKKELEAKLVELTNTKTAMLNMMEDAEELNRELIRTQVKLKENLKELKALDVKKDEFVSITSHELKTPITAIKGFIQLLHSSDVIDDINKRRQYLAIIDKETVRLEKLISDMLDLSKLDLNTVKFNFEKVNLNELTESLTMRFEPKAKEKGIAFGFEIDKSLPPITTDIMRLTQILSNIINNAINYTEKGGVKVNTKQEGEMIHFSVADTGIGIPKKHFDKLFHRFYQVDSSMTRKTGGSGLGLAICRGFVERLGGMIWLESEVGRGSTFLLTVPISQKDKGIGKQDKT